MPGFMPGAQGGMPDIVWRQLLPLLLKGGFGSFNPQALGGMMRGFSPMSGAPPLIRPSERPPFETMMGPPQPQPPQGPPKPGPTKMSLLGTGLESFLTSFLAGLGQSNHPGVRAAAAGGAASMDLFKQRKRERQFTRLLERNVDLFDPSADPTGKRSQVLMGLMEQNVPPAVIERVVLAMRPSAKEQLEQVKTDEALATAESRKTARSKMKVPGFDPSTLTSEDLLALDVNPDMAIAFDTLTPEQKKQQFQVILGREISPAEARRIQLNRNSINESAYAAQKERLIAKGIPAQAIITNYDKDGNPRPNTYDEKITGQWTDDKKAMSTADRLLKEAKIALMKQQPALAWARISALKDINQKRMTLEYDKLDFYKSESLQKYQNLEEKQALDTLRAMMTMSGVETTSTVTIDQPGFIESTFFGAKPSKKTVTTKKPVTPKGIKLPEITPEQLKTIDQNIKKIKSTLGAAESMGIGVTPPETLVNQPKEPPSPQDQTIVRLQLLHPSTTIDSAKKQLAKEVQGKRLTAEQAAEIIALLRQRGVQ